MNNNNLEIERKFLIEYPNFNKIDYDKKIKISQSYLIRKNDDIERRIRYWCEDDVSKYYYTEKKFLSGFTRQEVETEITQQQYDNLLKEVDTSIVTVEKIRYTISYCSLIFEIDVYPFSKKFAIMEVELDDENQAYTIPSGINVLKEVTGIKEFGNIPLCTSKKFPEYQ